jgi:translocation and assembly module TamB
MEAPAAAMPPSLPAPKPRRRWWLLALDAALLLPLLVLAWFALSESGLRWAMRAVSAASGGVLVAGGVEGRLLGEWRIGKLEILLPGLRASAAKVELAWRPAALLRGRLHLTRLAAAELDVASAPGAEPARVPADLRLPLPVSVDVLRVGTLRVGRLEAGELRDPTVLTAVAARAHSDGRRHRVEQLDLAAGFGTVQAQAELDGKAPFDTDLRAVIEGRHEGRPVHLALAAAGPLERLVVSAGASGLDLSGHAVAQIRPFEPVPVGRVQIQIGEIDPAAFVAGAPAAALRIRADLEPQAPPAARDPPAAVDPADWVVSGPLQIDNLKPALADRGGVPLRSLSATLLWRAGSLSLSRIELLALGRGRAGGSAAWSGGALSADLQITDLNLAEVAAVLAPTRLFGALALQAQARTQRLRADLRDPRFVASFDATHDGGRMEVRSARLAARGAELAFSGGMDLGGRGAFQARGRLVRFDPSLYLAVPAASLNADFDARGQTRPGPSGELRFALRGDSRFDGRPLEGRGEVTLLPGRLARADVDLQLAGNALSAQGAFGAPGDRLDMRIDAPRLAALGVGVEGRLEASGHVEGTLAQPAGALALSAHDLLLPGGHRVGTLEARGELRDGAQGPFTVSAAARGLRPAGSSAPPQQATLEVAGTRASHALRLRAELPPNDRLIFEARGGLADGLEWVGSAERFEFGERLVLRLTAPASLRLAPGRFVLGPAELAGRKARIRLDETRLEAGQIFARGQMSGAEVGLALDRDQRVVPGGGGLRLGARWDLRLGARANGSLRLEREDGDIVLPGDTPVSLGLQRVELLVHAIEDRLGMSLQVSGTRLGEIAGSATALALRTEDGWKLAPDALLAGTLVARMPSIAWIGPLVSPNLQTSGALAAEFSVTGTSARPNGEGTIRGSELSLALADEGLRLSGGSLRMHFTPDALKLEELAFVSPNRVRPRDARIDVAGLAAQPGRLNASGELELASRRGQFDFSAQRLPLLQREDRWLMMSGEGRLELAELAAKLTAKLRADGGYLELAGAGAPSLGDDVVVKGREPRGRRLALALDVEANLGRSVYLVGRGLDTRLSGEVRLRGDGKGLPQAVGSLRTVGGTFDAYGQELAIERGIVNFQGPVDNPGLNVVALRKNLPVEAGVEISGTAQQPRVRLVSEPNVPDAEKLSWIVLGRAPDQAGARDPTLLLAAARAILGDGAGEVSRDLMRGIGIDALSLTEGDVGSSASRLPTTTVAGRLGGGSTTVGSQIVTIGKRLSADAYLSYEQSLAGAGNVVKLTYELSRRLSVIGRAGSENAVDLFYTFSFN